MLGMGVRMEVVEAGFVASKEMSVDDLFEGFDAIKVITYSSGMDFMAGIIGKFFDAEVVFGSPAVLDQKVSTVMNVERKVIETLALPKNVKKFSERLEDGTLRFFVSRDMRSHEKLYLLEGAGRRRVITGSANFSGSAFFGVQREIVTVFDDDDAAWEYFMARYIAYRDACSDYVEDKVITAVVADPEYLADNPAELPVLQVKDVDVVVIQETVPDEYVDEIVFVADIRGREGELREYAPNPRLKNGAIVINSKIVERVKRKSSELRAVFKQRRRELTKLDIDYARGTLSFNGDQLDLSPGDDEVARDIAGFVRYIDSLDDVFHGNVDMTQGNYWRFANWYFATPFAPRIRYEAYYNHYDLTNVPVVGIMYGDSNGGKSTFTRLLAKMMSGENVELLSSSYFTPSYLNKVRANCTGVPVHVDDLSKKQWNSHYETVVKDDYYGILTEPVLLNYPAICISTNNVPSLKPEISKRVVMCRVSARIDRETGSRMAKRVNDIQVEMGNALFREYASRMLPLVEEMVDGMRSGDVDVPDIFALSSNVMCSIFEEHLDALPAWMTRLDFDDYFGNETVAQGAIAKVRNAWLSEPGSFTVNEVENKLVWTYPEGGPLYELRYVRDELPVQLDADASGRSLVMDLSAARELFGLDFKVPWYRRIFARQ